MLKYSGPLYVVEDIAVSRQFYEQLLGQKVQMDFGVNVSFEGNFSIHLKSHFQGLLGDPALFPVTVKAHNGELYFDSDEIDTIFQRLKNAGVEFLHEIREQPWAQRVLRFYDPDGHIIEIGEFMEATVLRLHQQGLSAERIREKTGMPIEFVNHALQESVRSGKAAEG
jgi:catechol 2,3-dioxygenase-like lactoylglutathione lyase family enzyme